MKKKDKNAAQVLKTGGATQQNKNFFTPITIVSAAFLAVAVIMCVILVCVNLNEVSKESERLTIIKSGRFNDGITISGIDVSGMTYDEAYAALRPIEDELASQIQFTLTYDDVLFHLDQNNLNVLFNTADILDEAIMLGKTGGYMSIKNDMNTYNQTGVSYEIDYELDATPLSDELDAIIAQIYVEPQNATAQIDTSLSTNYSNVINGFPFIITEAQDGVTIDKEGLYNTLNEMAQNRDFGMVTIPVSSVEAEISADELRENLVLRSYFNTSYSNGDSSNRVYNMQKAADLVNHSVVLPGEEFSANTVLGPRTTARGWRDAPAVIGGGAATEDQPGGGVCQISTTLYNALVKADIEIVYRQNHSKQSTYVDGGLDATINTGTIDFVWKNNTDSPVYVFSWLDRSSKKVYCAIYAERFPDAFDSIDFESEYVNAIEPTATEYTTSSSLQEGQWMLRNEAITGHVYNSYAHYYKDGKLVNTEFVAKSTYRMHPKRYYVYPGYVAGTPLDPSKEVIVDANGNWVPKYSHTDTEPTQEPPVSPTEPTTPPAIMPPEPTPTLPPPDEDTPQP